MPQKIVANGCSYTQELYLNKKDRWTTKIGAVDNLALGGGSNERIFYTTIEYLNHHNPDVVIIGWTSTARFMLPGSNGSRIVITPTHSFDEQIGGDESAIAEFYYKHCHNDYTSLERTLNYIIHLQKVCALKRIKLLNFTSFLEPLTDAYLKQLSKDAFMSRVDKDTENMGIRHNHKRLRTLLDLIDKNLWIKEFWYSMAEHCKSFPLKDDHPNVEGSNHWAKLVSSYL
jgi:hypothetical protein